MGDLPTFGYIDRFDDPVSRGTDHVFHLHRFDDQELVAGRDLLTRPDGDEFNFTGKWRGEGIAR